MLCSVVADTWPADLPCLLGCLKRTGRIRL
jgi:hypothetical protein